jgi:hypothetical protein
MVVAPAATPVTMPVVAPIVAIEVVLLVQLPPLTPLVSVAVAPAHTDKGPVIAPGASSTESNPIAEHPLGSI